MADVEKFFKTPMPQSLVKMQIIAEYFVIWAKILGQKSSCRQLRYLDLFAGRGYYEDGSAGTPVRIMNAIVEELPEYSNRIVLEFYEKNRALHRHLKSAISSHPACDLLSNMPVSRCKEVSGSMASELRIDDCTLSFLDPCGYKGISLELLRALLTRWGCDCLFFLSTQGIRRNIELDTEQERLKEVLGSESLLRLRESVSKNPHDREFGQKVVRELRQQFRCRHSAFTLPFAVRSQRNKGISHYLIFVSKSLKGFRKMLEVMANHSAKDENDWPTYIFERATQLDLVNLSRREQLSAWLTQHAPSIRCSVKEVIDICNRNGMLVLDRHIKETISHMRSSGLVDFHEPAGKKLRRGTCPEWLQLQFLRGSASNA